MGLYNQNSSPNYKYNNDYRRRSSLDFIGVDEYVKDEGLKRLDLGRDSVIDPTDITAILRKKQKESKPVYRLETWSVYWSFFSMNKEGKYFVLLKSGRNNGVILFVAWSLGGILLFFSAFIYYGTILLCAKAIQLTYGRSVVLLRCLLVPETMRGGGTLGLPVRKRLNILLHTHIALITVCVLSSLDAICVIGQVICDILIMSEKLSDFDKLHERSSELLVDVLPGYFNNTDHTAWSFEQLIDHIEKIFLGGASSHHLSEHVQHHSNHSSHENSVLSLISDSLSQSRLSRSVRSSGAGDPTLMAGGGGGHGDEEHSLAYEFTHSFHIGSMALLSALLLETFLKIFAMGKHFLNHKLEIFDAFVIMVSWCLDVAFWEGIWARPGQEGATLLMFILPWRVIRIVNSFVLVIQEKDLVLLKVVKQRLRFQLRKDKESTAKLDKYRLEVRQLQGLCRRSGADENSIQACCPTGRRRRSSLFQSLTSLASVALVSAMGSSPKLGPDNVSSSSDSDGELDKELKKLPRIQSTESDINVKFDIFPEPEDFEHEIIVKGSQNNAFTFDETDIKKFEKNEPGNNKKEGLSTKL